jgi:glycerol kinase
MDAVATNFYLCLDQGGHASRALVFDSRGQVHAKAFCNIDTQREGVCVEHDPEQLVSSLRSAATEALAQLGSSAVYLVAAGLATQRSSIVCWERDSGAALSPVISWQDTRAAKWLEQFADKQNRVHAITGLVLSPHYGVSKLRWCLDHLPAVEKAAAEGNLVFGPLASFLAYRLAEQSSLLADPANASRTLLWDRHVCDWSAELLQLFNIPRACLPESVPNKYDWGTLQLDGLSLPLDIVTGDQSAALFAFGEPDPATLYTNMGTGAFLQRTVVDEPVDSGRLLASVVYQGEFGSTSVIEGTVNGAGSAINQVANELAIDTAQLKAHSGAWLESFSGQLFFLNAVSGLGSPWWLADAQSQFIFTDGSAASGASGPEKIAAVMESIVFLLATNLMAMNALAVRPQRLLVTGGLGAVDALLQRLANVSGMAVERAQNSEATARGLGCLLAGIPDNWPAEVIDRAFLPQADVELQARFRRWQDLMPPLPAS